MRNSDGDHGRKKGLKKEKDVWSVKSLIFPVNFGQTR